MKPGLVALALFVFLIAVSSARAESGRSDRLTEIVTTVAGRTVDVSCETRGLVWKREVQSAHLAAGAVAYYDPELDLIRFGPLICKDLLTLRQGASLSSVRGLFIVAHEAAHASGVDNEGTANCWGLYWAQNLARRFNGVRFFTPASRRVLALAKQIHRGAPPNYQRSCPV